MAKVENKTKTKAKSASKSTAKRKPKAKAKASGSGFSIRSVIDFAKSEKGRKVFALSLILFSVFLFVATLSYLFNGHIDQDLIESGDLGNSDPANWMGYLGAKFAFLFVTRGFGVMSLLIPLFMGVLGFAMLENRHYKFVFKAFKYTLFAVLWGSAFLGFITLAFWDKSNNLGGGFGAYVNESMFKFVGAAGMGIVVFLTMSIFVVVSFDAEFNIIRWAERFLPIGKKSAKSTEEPVAEEADETVVAPVAEKVEAVEVAAETTEEPAEKEKAEDDFVISVTPVNAEKVAPATERPKLEIPVSESLSTENGGSIPLETAVPPVAPPKTDGLELEISDVKPDPEIPVEPVTAVTPPDPTADNIVKTEENKFEKFVPKKDQESLDPEEDVGDWEQYDPTRELSDYVFPTIDLLNQHDNKSTREVNRAELEENKNKIIQTLKNYSIEITKIKATIGPTVTLYEIVPAPGIRISKIRNLEDDIALSLAALGIRIIAPIPGKGTIGIEIPNSQPEIVSMRSTLATEKFKNTKAELPLALGRTISNEVYIADLAKMPHLLIAGATGQGKSVGINGIISSILYKKHPAQVKFVLIDPKKVELNLYSALEKHFLAKLPTSEDAIITDTKQVIGVLNSLCIEMDERYDLLKKAKVRNIREYNDKFTNRRLNPRKGHRYLPYIVLVIDEFADLMMTAGKEIEGPIARLAQLARAIGIHLILATQRPSVNVITGIIKANFPARVSFRVTSKVDSRTILDSGGADQLIGRGDMLLSTGSDLIRIQNSFIDTPEVDKLVDFINDQRGYSQAYYLPEVPDPDSGGGSDALDAIDRDDLFEDAARLIVKHQQGSTSLIQRRLSLGYNRAGRIIDQLERAGIVGPFSGSKARDVLVPDEFQLEQILNGNN